MKQTKFIVAFCILLSSVAQLRAQDEANALLGAVYNKMQKAKDYAVKAKIKVDMPFIRMLPVDVKIYFKQKDKFKVETKKITVVPREGFDQLSKVMTDPNSFTAILQGGEKVEGVQTNIVNVIPLSDTSDLILAKFWIDPARNVIIKSQLTTRTNGTIETEFSYGSQVAYGLPDKMIFQVDVKKFKVPKGFVTRGMDKKELEKEEKGKEKKKGKILIVFTGYEVNKGIPDSVFASTQK